MNGPLSLRLPPALAQQLVDQLPSLADEVVTAIGREVPAYARPLEGVFGAGVRRGVQLALTRFLALAGQEPEGDEARAAEGRDVYRALGRGEARVGRSLDALLGAYRTGARVAWARLAQLGLDAGLPATDLVQLAAAVFAYIDELSAASARGFAEEQSKLAGDRERSRRGLGQLLLSDAPPWQLDEAAAVAAWPAPATLTAVLVPLADAGAVASRWDERVLLAAEDDPAGTALLLLGDVDGPGQGDRLDRLLVDRPAVVGLPRPWHEARLSAALVRRVATVCPGPAPQHVADRLSALVVTADPLALEELRTRRLAPFTGVTPRSRERLLDTLRSWLGHHGERAAVAAELGVHPQTVRYRVGLLRDLLGADLEDPQRRFELALVLHTLPAVAPG